MQSVASTEINPVGRNLTSSPSAATQLKITLLKAVLVLACNVLTTVPQPQSIILLGTAALLLYFHLRWVPYYCTWLNHMCTGLWGALLAVISILVALTYSEQALFDVWRQQTTMVGANDMLQCLECQPANWMTHR